MAAIMGQVSGFLEWILTQCTQIVSWATSNDLAMIYISMFVAGSAIAFLVRILRSV